MNNKIVKQLSMFLSFLLVFAQLSFAQPLISNAAPLDQAVTVTAIDGSGEKVINTSAVAIEEGDTAWDVLGEAADSLDFDESEWGKMLQGINGVEADFDKDGNFWAFFINGTAASVGIDSYSVQHGDNILFVLSDDMETTQPVTVSAIDEDGNEVVANTKVQLATYATAYDAIVQAIDEIEVNVDDQYFSFIENINGYEKADNEFWELFVNDESLQVGALSHQIQPGEHIQLRLQSFDDSSDDSDSEDDESETDEDEGKKDEEKENQTGDGEKDQTGEDEENSNNENEKTNEDSTEEKKDELEGQKSSLSDEAKSQVETDVNFLINKVLENDLATKYGHEWWVWGLGAAKEPAPSSYTESIDAIIKETQGDLGSVTELEKVIIALSAQGIDATDVAGYDLVDLLINHEELDNPMINAAIYALIAINSGEYDVDADKEDQLIQFILDAEVADGGWAFFGSTPSVDITGMALIALAPYQEQDEVKEKIDRAVNYLSEEQHDNGGYYDEWNGGYSSESAAQAIMGLLSVGVDPTDPLFTKTDGNLIDYLLQFRVTDGYSHVLTDESSNPFADQQALLALAYFNNFIQGNAIGGGVEEDGGKTPPEKPTEKPSKKPTNNPETDDDKDDIVKEDDDTQIVQVEDADGTAKDGQELPKTNTNLYNYIGIGLLIILAGIGLLFIQRKRIKQS